MRVSLRVAALAAALAMVPAFGSRGTGSTFERVAHVDNALYSGGAALARADRVVIGAETVDDLR